MLFGKLYEFAKKNYFKKEQSIGNNVNIYELTPTSEVEDETYFNYLKAAIDKAEVTNVALSGPYGSGKSSILKVLTNKLKDNKNYKFLNISLATFKVKDEEKEITADEYREIEKSIIQQMFYSVEQKEIANSRFKRIKFDKYLNENTIYFTIWIISIIELFTPYTFIFHMTGKFNSFWLLTSIFIVGTFFISKKFLKNVSNVKLSKFMVQSQEISFDNDAQTSILNSNIDEILYFFNETKYNVVIIEDLDRFNNTEIFVKLREINTLLNNKKDSEKITFVYAIRDDMFKDKDRTKFFDYIIPVVPFINSSNSSKILCKYLENENILDKNQNRTLPINHKKIKEKFIKDISIYINDMRFLINVFNEFLQYTHKIKDDIKLDYTTLFAISLYKNYNPIDFAKLHNNEGILYTIFSSKYKNSILKKLSKNLKNEIKEIESNIQNITSLNVNKIEELRSLYIHNLMLHENKVIVGFRINHNDYDILDIIKNEEKFKLISTSQANLNYLSANDGLRTSSLTFKELEKLVDEVYSYNELIINLSDKSIFDWEKEVKFLNEKKQNLINIENSKLSELFQNKDYKYEEIIDDELLSEIIYPDKKDIIKISNDLLIKYLLTFRYIKEDYFKYISYYHEGQESPNDINFIINIHQNIPNDWNLELNSFEFIFNELDNPIYFSKESILNFSLVEKLFENEGLYEEQIKNLIQLITSNLDKFFTFLDQFIKNNPNTTILLHICMNFDKFLFFVYYSNYEDRKYKYFYNIFNSLKNYNDINAFEQDFGIKNDNGLFDEVDINESINIDLELLDSMIIDELLYARELKLLTKLDKNNSLVEIILLHDNFGDFENNIIDMELFKTFIKTKSIKFKSLKDIDKNHKDFNFIYENSLYEINIEWIEKILYDTAKEELKSKNYSSILQSNKNYLISYINKNINLYVKNVLLLNENLEDDEKDIIKLLNNKELKDDNKIIIIDRYAKTFNDISEICFSWEHLLKNNKIAPTLNNLRTCLDSDIDKKYIQDFINFESTYSAIFDTPNKFDQDEIKNLKLEDIIFDSKNIEIETFEAFLKSINYVYEFLPTKLEYQFIQYMIELKKVETNPQNYQILIDRNFNELAFKLIENEPNDFIEAVSLFNIDNESYIELISRNKITDIDKINLLNILDITELMKSDDENKTFRDILYDLKIKYFNDFIDIDDEIFNGLMTSDLSENKKIELFIKYKFKDRNEVTNAILNINVSFEKLTHLVSGPISLDNSSHNIKLVKKLKEIKYISSYTEKNKEIITVYTFQTEKEIN